MFTHQEISFDILKKRAFNLRWASVPEGVIPLTAADPDFPCALQITEAINKFTSQRYFSYAPAEGYSFFREAVANFHTLNRNIKVEQRNVLAVDSAAYGIYMVCKTFLQKGDEAIVFDPVDFLFKYSVEANHGIAVPFAVPIEPNGIFNFENLAALITPKTKMICLCNPLNPTGKVLTKEELTKIGDLAVKHNLIILSDEIWSDIVFEPNIYTSIASISEAINQQTIIVTGYSKSYGLAGLRVGSVIAPNDNIFNLLLLKSEHQSTIHGCNVLAQVAVTAALNECKDWLKDFVLHLTKMRNLCVDGLNKIDGFDCLSPQGCYLVFPDITKTGMTAQELQTHLLNEAKVAVVPGLSQWFGQKAAGHIRISFATSEEIINESLYRISKAINKI
ncbi:MAG: pyridoxal phosphate-dependent aminotransferase [Bacteroidia bacterium]|nr:pyridoxal phosphate-dependent aminotransferase [Bacteroidia bacterium]